MAARTPKWLLHAGRLFVSRLGGRNNRLGAGAPLADMRPQARWAGPKRGDRPDDVRDPHVLRISAREINRDEARRKYGHSQRQHAIAMSMNAA